MRQLTFRELSRALASALARTRSARPDHRGPTSGTRHEHEHEDRPVRRHRPSNRRGIRQPDRSRRGPPANQTGVHLDIAFAPHAAERDEALVQILAAALLADVMVDRSISLRKTGKPDLWTEPDGVPPDRCEVK
jgi:hypothetical protein